MTFTVRSARPADAAGMARVHVEGWRQTYRGLMTDEILDAPDFVDRREMALRIVRSTCSTSLPITTAPASAPLSWTRWPRHPQRTCCGWPIPILARRPSLPSTDSCPTEPCVSTRACTSWGW